MERIHLFGTLTTISSSMIVYKAFMERQGQFFTTCVQITESNLNLLVICADADIAWNYLLLRYIIWKADTAAMVWSLARFGSREFV
jgi:hypothetical protein